VALSIDYLWFKADTIVRHGNSDGRIVAPDEHADSGRLRVLRRIVESLPRDLVCEKLRQGSTALT
jgi:hypothetical protein